MFYTTDFKTLPSCSIGELYWNANKSIFCTCVHRTLHCDSKFRRSSDAILVDLLSLSLLWQYQILNTKRDLPSLSCRHEHLGRGWLPSFDSRRGTKYLKVKIWREFPLQSKNKFSLIYLNSIYNKSVPK